MFDQSDGSARLLRSRCGHSAPPTRLRFCSTGEAVKILSTGINLSSSVGFLKMRVFVEGKVCVHGVVVACGLIAMTCSTI